MEDFLSLCATCMLFDGVAAEDLPALLQCLKAKQRVYAKGAVLLDAGESAEKLGLVLSGRVNTVYEDLFGGRSIIGTMERGQLFCDAFAFTKSRNMPVSVVAQTDSTVLLLDAGQLLRSCEKSCPHHGHLAENLIRVLAEKYATLSHKVIHLSGRTTRRKLLSYLSEQMQLAGGNPFPLPFNQQELADYLFIDRSGLSTEWNRLKREGILCEERKLLSLYIPPCAGGDCGEEQPSFGKRAVDANID